MGLDKIPPHDGNPLHSANTEAFQAPYQSRHFQPSIYSPQPQRRRPFKQWYRAQTKTARILLGCLPFYVAFILCIGSFTVYAIAHPQPPAQKALATSVTHNNPTTHSVPTATPTTLVSILPTNTPTTPQSPTPTPNPTIALSDAILGGSIHAFDQKFGANNCCYRNEWTPPTGPAVGVWDDTYSQWNNLDESSMNRVVRIDILPQGSDIWSTSQAATICDVYLPSDAKYQAEYTVPLGNLTQGSVKVYYSTLLANALPAHDFIGKDGKQGKSGTIYIYFDYSYNGGSINIGDCVVGIKGNDVSTP